MDWKNEAGSISQSPEAETLPRTEFIIECEDRMRGQKFIMECEGKKLKLFI